MLAGLHAVVLGATGAIGSGAVRKFLDAGATVVGVSRSAERLRDLEARLQLGPSDRFLGVVGDFRDEASAEAAAAAVTDALAGGPIDHVVSAQGFVSVGPPPTSTDLAAVRAALDDGLYTNFLAARVFLPALKSREGSSFTLVSGGLAHIPPPRPALWLGTVKNAAINALTLALAAETAADRVRVNTVCIHMSVAPIGGDKNGLGMPAAADSLQLGGAFVGIARGAHKGKVLCVSSFAEAALLAG